MSILLAFSLPFLTANILSGQTGTFLAVFLMLACSLFHDRPLMAGIFIGFIAVKPQLGILLPFVLVAAGQWRTFVAATVTILFLAAFTTAWLGFQIWFDYLQMVKVFGSFIGQGYDGIRQLAVGPYVSLISVGVSKFIALVLQGVATITVFAIIVHIFHAEGYQPSLSGQKNKVDLRFGLLAAGTLLVTPYSLTYDTPLLILSIIPIVVRAWRDGWNGRESVAITAVITMPFVQPFAVELGIPYGFLAVSGLFLVLYLRYRVESDDDQSSVSTSSTLKTSAQ